MLLKPKLFLLLQKESARSDQHTLADYIRTIFISKSFILL
jgi:hypothetical protein